MAFWALATALATALPARAEPNPDVAGVAVRETAELTEDSAAGRTQPAVLTSTTEAAATPQWRGERGTLAAPVWALGARGLAADGSNPNSGEGLGLGLRGDYALTRRLTTYALVSESLFHAYGLSRYEPTLTAFDSVIPRDAQAAYAATTYALAGVSYALTREATWVTQAALWTSFQGSNNFYRRPASALRGEEVITRVEEQVTERHLATISATARQRRLDADAEPEVTVRDLLVWASDRWTFRTGRSLTLAVGKVGKVEGVRSSAPVLARARWEEDAPYMTFYAEVDDDYDADPSRFPPGAERTAKAGIDRKLTTDWSLVGFAEGVRFDGADADLGPPGRERTELVRGGLERRLDPHWRLALMAEALWTQVAPGPAICRPGLLASLEWRPRKA